MTDGQYFNDTLQQLVALVESLSQFCGQDSDRLLALLRTLESLHRQIRTEQFEPSLPNTRKDLYDFLKDVEESGGWPYIERGKLQTFLQHWMPPEESARGTSDLPEMDSSSPE